MILTFIDNPFPHIIITEYFDDKELKRVWKELDFLTYDDKLMPPDVTGSGAYEDGQLKKQNKGIWLDEVYKNRDISDILTIGRKIFDNQEIRKEIFHHNWLWSGWANNIGEFNTLLSYYEDSDHYDSHFDSSYFTHLIHLFKEPKEFQGGELYFPDFDYKLDNVSNRLLIFPSSIDHEVLHISMDSDKKGKGKGRYSITQFCHSI